MANRFGKYVDLSSEERKSLTVKICQAIQDCVDNNQLDEIGGFELTVTPTLKVKCERGGWHHDFDFVDIMCRYLVEDENYIVPDIDAIAELVDDRLFEYPDYDEWAKDFAKMDGMEKSINEDELRKQADKLFEESKFDLEEYLAWERSRESLPDIKGDSIQDFIDWDQEMFGPHKHF